MTLRVSVGENKLLVQVAGSPIMDLVPVSKTKFRSEIIDLQIDFGINKSKEITKVLAIKNGNGKVATKIK